MKNGLKICQREIFKKNHPTNKHYVSRNKKKIESFGFFVVSYDFEKPWGGFLVINESQAQEFSNKFFKGLCVNNLKIGWKLSSKILIVKLNARLSWQYHNRRGENWQVYKGTAGIIRSDSDK